MFDGEISQMCKVKVRAMRIIGGNLLNILLLVLISIVHSDSLLRVSCVMMSPYIGGMDRLVIGPVWVFQCMWQYIRSRGMGQRSRIMHAGGQGL